MTVVAVGGSGAGLDRNWLAEYCREYQQELDRHLGQVREDVTSSLERLVRSRETLSASYQRVVAAARATAHPHTTRAGTSRAVWIAHREHAGLARERVDRLAELHRLETIERSTLMLLDRVVPLLPSPEDLLTSLTHAVAHLRSLGERSPVVVRMDGPADLLTRCIPERLLARLDAHVPPKSRDVPLVETWRRAAPHTPLSRGAALEDPEAAQRTLEVVHWNWKGEEETWHYVQPTRRIDHLVDGAHRIHLGTPSTRLEVHVGPADLTAGQWEVYDILVRDGGPRAQAAEGARGLVPGL